MQGQERQPDSENQCRRRLLTSLKVIGSGISTAPTAQGDRFQNRTDAPAEIRPHRGISDAAADIRSDNTTPSFADHIGLPRDLICRSDRITMWHRFQIRSDHIAASFLRRQHNEAVADEGQRPDEQHVERPRRVAKDRQRAGGRDPRPGQHLRRAGCSGRERRHV